MSSIITSGLKSFTLASVLAIATTVGVSAAADAASPYPSYNGGDFSAFFGTSSTSNVFKYQVDDCLVEVGIVVDWLPGPYRYVGGARVNCNSIHPRIYATVALVYW